MGTLTQNGSNACDVICLQLKKPKSWNWELSTSKSSPQIILPTIKLYNSKGELLLEAKDHSLQRRSWNSSDVDTEVSKLRQLKKSKSDIFHNSFVSTRKSKVQRNDNNNAISLQKCCSDFSQQPMAKDSLRKSRSVRDFHCQLNARDDVLFRKILKQNDESVKMATSGSSGSLSNEEQGRVLTKEHNGYKHFLNNSGVLPEVNCLTHKRYKTRTCSAGTLIIEESFKYENRRRRQRVNPKTKIIHEKGEDKHLGSFSQILHKHNREKCAYDLSSPVSVKKKPMSRSKYLVNELGTPYSNATVGKGRDCVLDLRGGQTSNHSNQRKVDDANYKRRLWVDHDIRMGANVSRHSSKGLHGRRSQSSGSICNSKDRHASSDNKMCGSLPSYLDDRNSHSCNNNHHDCENSQLHGVERIPSLGNAAPLHWKFSDTQAVLQCDQGYGSERSPEEEYTSAIHDGAFLHYMDSHTCYPFITPESTFSVALTKGSRGLGLSVSGGTDSGNSWPGLIRIKRLFPHQPAATSGLLNVGDLLLEVNGITLTGLTNYEALEVLRTASSQVELTVCRPPPDVLSCVSPISEVPPPPPRRDPPNSLNLTPPPYQPTPEDDLYHGEFEITLTKIHGSLGFTLRKEDESALGHYVRALVREPALSDGRIRAGDKIITVNDVEISSMTHEQAVQYLRQAGDVVILRLYRDPVQTPLSTLSPSEVTPRNSLIRKPNLRPEALDMLNDIAMRKTSNQDTYLHSTSPNTSPRRLRRQPYSSESSQATDTSAKYLISDEQFHEGLFKKPSLALDDEADLYNSLFSVDSDDCDRPSRPSSLDLCNSKGTPVITRKPKFNFSLAHNAYELNNLDPEILDAPNLSYNLGKDDINNLEAECSDTFPQQPVSMPHIPSDSPEFSYKNPAYQSAHPPCGNENFATEKVVDGNSIKKWKGIVFNVDENKGHATENGEIESEYVILSIELNRGWNSRLGFSLQGAACYTYVSAVHGDSVAAKDGRLKPGDRLLKVNDESVENMSTSEIIDLLRIVRGPVCIVVARYKSNKDCTYKKQC
ncbi:tyrosine-protein phosphatase non-receptor type 13-like isoform X3 [Photinus pyralis]|uniref:tyrosine-protein phosphatase non-receptor type 13-like isoform X3 n=1 Tax=Photinus pyralis TaxID=7054 RepID=UPI00126748E5|nr:tyrosine-protein phosphatase non-receptor type 13-like isoform X3 [Photinus pyralis]